MLSGPSETSCSIFSPFASTTYLILLNNASADSCSLLDAVSRNSRTIEFVIDGASTLHGISRA